MAARNKKATETAHGASAKAAPQPVTKVETATKPRAVVNNAERATMAAPIHEKISAHRGS